MKNKLLLLLALSIAFFTGCKDDDDPEPPTIDKIVGQYSGEILKPLLTESLHRKELLYKLFKKMTTRLLSS